MRSLSLAAFGAALLLHPAIGQDLPPDLLGDLSDDGGFEIEQDSGDGAGWSRYIGGTIGAVSADGDTISRSLAALQLDINLPAGERLKTVASIDFVDFENSYTQELREHIIDEGNPDNLPLEEEVTVTDNFADFREAYVQWDANDYATLKIGRQNLVWGQFEFLSPVGFLLPFRGTNISPRPTRDDFAYAQDAVNLSLFPTGNSELQLIHVPAMRLDPTVEENLKSYTQLRYCERNDNDEFINCGANTEFPDIADYDMSALRYTYYGENLIFAITALDGTQVSFDPYREARLVRDGDDFAYINDKGLAFDTLETVALEFSYILNLNWTLKGEYTSFETKEAVDPTYDNGREGQDNAMGRAIIEVNGGKPYITNDETFVALGFEYEGEDWFGHFQIVNFEFKPASADDEVLECIEDLGDYDADDRTCSGAQDEDDDGVAPIFFIGRKLGDADDGFAGFGATAFFNAYGAGFFGGWRFNENLEIGGFVGAVVDIANTGPPSSDEYESVDDGDALAQIGVSYLF